MHMRVGALIIDRMNELNIMSKFQTHSIICPREVNLLLRMAFTAC